MKQKIIKVLLLTSICAMILSGCIKSTTQAPSRQYVELTQTEEEILTNIFIDTDNISQGNLNTAEKETLIKMRHVEQKLNERYPDHKFTVASIELPVSDTEKQNFVAKGGLVVDNVHIDGKYECSYKLIENGDDWIVEDDYYGNLIRGRYDCFIKSFLLEEIPEVKVYTYFIAERSDVLEMTNMSGSEIQKTVKEDPKQTYIFVPISEDETKISEIIENVVKENELNASYFIYFLDDFDKPVEELLDFVQSPSGSNSKSVSLTLNSWNE